MELMKRAGLIATSVALGCSWAMASPEAIPAENPVATAASASPVKAELDARTRLRKLLEFQTTLSSYLCQGSVVIHSVGEGASIDLLLTLNAAFERPHKSVLSYLGEGAAAYAGQAYICDGRDVFFYRQKANEYTTLPLSVALQKGENNKARINPDDLYLISAARPDEVEEVMSKIQNVRYLGIKSLQSGKCHHFSFDQVADDYRGTGEVWIDAAEPTLVRRVSQVLPEREAGSLKGSASARSRALVEKMKQTMIVEIESWEINPKLEPDTFLFEPPEGCVRTEVP